MSSRNTETYRDVTNVVAQDKGSVLGSIGDVGAKVIAAGQEAKIAENFSAAQLDVNKLQNQYQLDYQDNPFGGMKQFQDSQKEIFDKYGAEISPFFKGYWNDSTRDYSTKTKAEMEDWGFKQTRVNTVKSINTSIQNNMGQAVMDGQKYGNDPSAELGSFMNYAASKEKLALFGDKHVGKGQTTQLLEDYDQDYMKSFISGVSDANPLKALRMMDDPQVSGAFRKKGEYVQMREAIGNRAMKVDQINAEKQVLSTLKDENNVLTQSLQSPISYAALQQAFGKSNMSPSAQAFFLKANGYETRGGKLTESQQFQGKAALYEDLSALTSNQDATSTDISKFQERIYSAMDNGTLNQNEGMTFINQLLTPFIGTQEKKFKNFGENKWFTDSIGFQGVQESFNDKYAVPVPEAANSDKPTAAEKTEIAGAEAINNANKVKLYDYYMNALQDGAAQFGIPVGEVPNLGGAQKRKLYSEAQAKAEKLFLQDINPALATLPDAPNQVFTKGQIIQGAAGQRDIKPDFTAKGNFVIIEKNGHRARRYADGTIEVLN